MIVEEFVKSFEDCTVPDSSKKGAGAVAFSKVPGDDTGNLLLKQSKMELLKSPLSKNIRIVSGLLESICAYDTPTQLNLYISKCLTTTNATEFYAKALQELFQKFKYAKIGLQYLLLSTQGMTERELRLALGKDTDRVHWIEFCFCCEPAFIVRSGVFLRIANRHCSEALQTTFANEYDRISVTKQLLNKWKSVIMPKNKDEKSVLLRGTKEKYTLLYRSWQAFPSLDVLHHKRFGTPTWEELQHFRKSQHASRDSLWSLMSQWESLAGSLSRTNSKHSLMHYCRVLPKKKDSANFLLMVRLNFIQYFKLPRNFFSMNNFFGMKDMFKPTNANEIGCGCLILASFVRQLNMHFSTFPEVLNKLLIPTARVSASDLGHPLCKDSNEMYCSSSTLCEEELSLLERGVLILLGIPSFNASQDVHADRFCSMGEDSVTEMVDGCLRIATLCRNELVGSGRLLRSYRHRIVLPPLRTSSTTATTRAEREQAHVANIEKQLLSQINYLINTVMLDGSSSCVKVIVQKLKFKLLSLKTICRALLSVELDSTVRSTVRSTMNVISEGLGIH